MKKCKPSILMLREQFEKLTGRFENEYRLNSRNGTMHSKKILTAGKELNETNKVLILLHGSGSSGEDMLSFASYLEVTEYSLLALQATNNTWYPYSFLEPPAQNEPWLSSALNAVKECVEDLYSEGIPSENIYFIGFSQGACLTLEFVARYANKYGGVVAFTGGLIGDRIYSTNYKGDFRRTPFFIGTSDPDPHVPLERVYATTTILRSMNASVTDKIYNGMGHMINQDEIDTVNTIVFNAQN